MFNSRALKRVLVSGLQAPGVVTLFSPFRCGRASVFMLHRFAVPECGVSGHSVSALRRALGHLRKHRFELLSLVDLFRRLEGEDPPLRGAVAFTLDDGYFDQATVAAPVFAEFDCPCTTFATTGFLDRQLWMWWDRIEYVFNATARRELQVELLGRPVSYRWSTESQRAVAQDDFTQRCKRVPDAEKHAAIGRLAEAAAVELPAQAPPEYAPMSWHELRAAESRGMSFGPHTITHPVLARATDEQSPREIIGSWERLQAEASRPVPIFCYPNGKANDFGAREIAAIRSAGLRGALASTHGYADKTSFQRADGAFRVKRFAYQDNLPDFIQCVVGVERLKSVLRGEV
jgi:peptidoglycan/xylan/chitin deacetylase (PgdA/CDA1 family)